jgi:hypothetical protein
MPGQTTPWEDWKAEFVKIFADYSGDPSCTYEDIARKPGWEAWRYYYDKGLGPWDAIVQDATAKE